MKRYGRSGWFNESHRHYLAGKGIKTKRYYSDDEKKNMMDKWKMTVASNAPTSEIDYRNQVVAKKEAEVRAKVMKQADERKIDTVNMQPLWVDLDKEREFYLQTGDEFQYKDNVDRKVKSHLGMNQRDLSPLSFIEEAKK